MKPSPITPTIDLDAEQGVQHGFLRLPYSRDDSAWGAIMIPITVIANGAGPTALLIGGNHGDEYEGPVALAQLANSLLADEVQGRVIILPYMNYPAFRAGTRTSPIDKGNLNRLFPGRPDGGVTEKIADHVFRELVARADYVLDIHAGGKTLDFVPFAAVHVLDDAEQQARCVAAMRAFNAPYSMLMLEQDNVGMLDTVVEAEGKVFVTTELGGGGAVTAHSVRVAKRGVRGFLAHAGILNETPPQGASMMLDMPDANCFVTAWHDGLVDWHVDLGEPVEADQVLATVLDIQRTGSPGVEYRALRDGVLVARHFPGLINGGDTLAVVGNVLDDPANRD